LFAMLHCRHEKPASLADGLYSAMDTILIATGNPHKLDEIRPVLGALGIECIGLDLLDETYPEPVEDGATFEDNARLKAIGYAKLTGRACLADDSGLEIDALGGRPGVMSARYFNDGAETDEPRPERDRLNNERVMRELGGTPLEARTARFVCALCLARPDGEIIAETRGTFEGRIGIAGEVPAGTNGFGYDPLFLVAPKYDRTSAQMSPAEKNAASHRGRALVAFSELLRQRENSIQ